MPSEIPVRLRLLRQRSGMDETQLAQAMWGVSGDPQAIFSWEQGRTVPSLQNLELVAKALDVELAELVGMEGLMLKELSELRRDMGRLEDMIRQLRQLIVELRTKG